MDYAITHRTCYRYEEEVSLSHHVVTLTPRTTANQSVEAHELLIEPEPVVITARTDYFGNRTHFFTVEGPHRTLEITARSRVTVTMAERSEPGTTPPWESIREACLLGEPTFQEAAEFVFDSPLIRRGPEFSAYAALSFPSGCPILVGAVDLLGRVYHEFTFDPKATTVATPLERVLREQRGVCQDFAQLQIGCLRSLGLPARYVSGYLEPLPPPGKPKLVGADASHAWVEVFCGESGWMPLDPTNNLIPGERHVVVAVGRDFADVSPVRGVMVGSGRHQLEVSVDVVPRAPDAA